MTDETKSGSFFNNLLPADLILAAQSSQVSALPLAGALQPAVVATPSAAPAPKVSESFFKNLSPGEVMLAAQLSQASALPLFPGQTTSQPPSAAKPSRNR